MGDPFCPNCQELSRQLAARDKRIEELEGLQALLEYDVKELRQKEFGKGKKKGKQEDKPLPKKRGAPLGHPGWFRKKPERIDVTEEVTLDHCPQCGGRDLTECQEIEEHIQEDIVLPKLKVTKYRRHHYYCKGCQEVVSGTGKEEIPHSYIGPQAKAVAAFLKYRIKVSQRDIQAIFYQLCGLRIVPSSIPGFHNQLRKRSLSLYEGLKEKIKKAPWIHADETGSRLDGKNHWDWVFATVHICLHVIRKSRGQKVVEEILGKCYGGVLISDFLSAYNRLEAKAKQRCLVHLLRDLKKALEQSSVDDPVHTYCQELKALLQRAIKLQEQYTEGNIAEQDFVEQRGRLVETLKDFQFPDPQKGILRRLRKRLARHKDELFTFLFYPGLPYHNNHAEQLIRPSVLLRKITFGNRSEQGALNHSVLMSVLQTAQLNGKEAIPLLREILLSPQDPPLSMCLGP